MRIHFLSHICSWQCMTSFHVNRWHRKYGGAELLLKKINKMEVNIKTCHVTYDISRDLNPEDLDIGGLHVEEGLKVITL